MALGEVVIFGSLNMDVIVGCDRHPQPGETIFGRSVSYLPGGKGLNQAVAAARWGTNACLIGACGCDDAGDRLLEFLRAENVDVSRVVRLENQPTGTALIAVSETGENTIIVVPGANAEASAGDPVLSKNGPIGLAPFEVPLSEIETFFRAIHSVKGRTILNPSPYRAVPETLLAETDILIVNEIELGQLTGAIEGSDEADVRAALRILNRPNQMIVVTLGGKGCLYCFDGEIQHFPAEKVEVNDTTGAGDCFAGILAACLAESCLWTEWGGLAYSSAVRRANAGAALSTTREGAAVSMPKREEIDRYFDRADG